MTLEEFKLNLRNPIEGARGAGISYTEMLPHRRLANRRG
jgi:hypothetical protein